jgi:hypothetical protein
VPPGVPSPRGAPVYLNGKDDGSPLLARIEPAAGRGVFPRPLVRDGIGSFALFEDMEGNRLALPSRR